MIGSISEESIVHKCNLWCYNFSVKSRRLREIVNGEMDSSGKEVIVKTISGVGNTEKANGEMSSSGITSLDANGATSRKRKRLIETIEANKKLAHCDIEDTEIANCRLQITPSSERLLVQSQVNDGQQIDTNIDKYCVTRSKKMLLILDVNGLLADIIHPPPKDCKSDINISRRAVFKRPFLDDFLGFCFERFDVAIWSSRTRKVLDRVVDYLLGDLKKKLVFLWDLSHCTSSSVRSLENQHKFIVFKKLGNIWEGNGYYDESNTLLLDDSPYKALLNPKHTGIFPLPHSYKDINDNSLGPDGDLRVYLEGVATSESVKMYVEQHPFGQRAIGETSPFWPFYSGVLKDVS
ncbi:hypothetical protein L1987_05547 [Smallanthus sonchifolius]|uniref:Uncharacterized protein n=1 Tax=Smallanthus sonchifolius TaxID=185202 RepID=A0ACB9JVP9_9ASTR|nr:hypothetical protein L1987_05547 [Smallanthus sonchifolius]